MNLAALLFDVARLFPERPAVSDGQHLWNYRELAERVAQLAGGLRGLGLRPGDRVLLCLENSGAFFELLFGCWAAGLCAVPANARLHPREVEYIADNSGSRLLFATPGLVESLAPLPNSVDTLADVICTDSSEYAALFKAEKLPPVSGAATDRAWLFYTSGTTGRPKGAVLNHRNLLFMSQCYYADIDRLDERDTHLLAAPVSHGAGARDAARPVSPPGSRSARSRRHRCRCAPSFAIRCRSSPRVSVRTAQRRTLRSVSLRS